MDKLQTFQDFLVNKSVQVSYGDFVINLLIAAVLSYLLGLVYIKFAASLSNRKIFARNFIGITMITMLIITIVKSSLALSLGLVGALSIVRFRTAIKEPEELCYLFFCISMGLGLGADQRAITLIAFLIIGAIFILIRRKSSITENENLFLVFSSDNPEKVSIDAVVEVLQKGCSMVHMKRFDESATKLESTYLVKFDSIDKLKNVKDELQKLDAGIKISFLDNTESF